MLISVADPDPGSGAFLTPGSQTHIYESLSENILGKNFNNSFKIGPNFFLQHFKNKKVFNFAKFVTTSMITNFFHPSLLFLFLDPESEIRDPGSGMGKNQDLGSGINIPYPQHWFKLLTV